jgi:hypothetical protein
MLDTPVPIGTLKLSNIGPGYYLDGRHSRLQGISGSAGTYPLPPPSADRVQSFQTDWDPLKQKNTQNNNKWKATIRTTLSIMLMRSIVMLSVIIMSIMLSVVMLNVSAPEQLSILAQGILKGDHCTIDLLFDWFGISCATTDNFCFYFAKQTNPNHANRSMVQWYFPL